MPTTNCEDVALIGHRDILRTTVHHSCNVMLCTLLVLLAEVQEAEGGLDGVPVHHRLVILLQGSLQAKAQSPPRLIK